MPPLAQGCQACGQQANKGASDPPASIACNSYSVRLSVYGPSGPQLSFCWCDVAPCLQAGLQRVSFIPLSDLHVTVR